MREPSKRLAKSPSRSDNPKMGFSLDELAGRVIRTGLEVRRVRMGQSPNKGRASLNFGMLIRRQALCPFVTLVSLCANSFTDQPEKSGIIEWLY